MISGILKNPILEVLCDIKITKILKQRNFAKRSDTCRPFQILLHFVYMIVLTKLQSAFIK